MKIGSSRTSGRFPEPPRADDGLTLLELMVVVVIAGILAALALPNFRRSAERRYWRQAQDLLEAIYVGERAYVVTTGSYHDPGVCDKASCNASEWEKIHVQAPFISSVPVAFDVDADNQVFPPTFTATATHDDDGRFMTIDQDHVLDLSQWPLP